MTKERLVEQSPKITSGDAFQESQKIWWRKPASKMATIYHKLEENSERNVPLMSELHSLKNSKVIVNEALWWGSIGSLGMVMVGTVGIKLGGPDILPYALSSAAFFMGAHISTLL